ncbi:unnamed protein product [Cunninghamella blakesleeana]
MDPFLQQTTVTTKKTISLSLNKHKKSTTNHTISLSLKKKDQRTLNNNNSNNNNHNNSSCIYERNGFENNQDHGMEEIEDNKNNNMMEISIENRKGMDNDIPENSLLDQDQFEKEEKNNSITLNTTTTNNNNNNNNNNINNESFTNEMNNRLETLSVKDMNTNNSDEDFISTSVITAKATAATPKVKSVGENVFTETCVKTWQLSRIKAWEGRYTNPEGYYYRFVIPGEGQQNGGWSNNEHKLFIERYNEWISNGWKIGASWGLFSRSIPHRVGYQCMNYYRKLVENKKLKDESYEIIGGKLKQTRKDLLTGTTPTTDLGSGWDDEYVKQIEKNVDEWLKQYHQRSGSAITRSLPKPKDTPKVIKNTSSRSKKIVQNKLIVRNGVNNNIIRNNSSDTNDDDFDDDDDFMMMEASEPEIAHLTNRNWEKEWNEKLDSYKDFISVYLDKSMRHDIWLAKQKWRRSLITTELLILKDTLAIKDALASKEDSDIKSIDKTVSVQTSLSKFFTGIKRKRVDTPDEFIHQTRIPKELFSGVNQIELLEDEIDIDVDDEKLQYHEVDDMMECVDILNKQLMNEEVGPNVQSQIESILVDPPWEFHIKDGKNDGSCQMNLNYFTELMAQVLKFMSSGFVFVWTHKLIQADVVRVMYSLDCRYVENLVWFKKSTNNMLLDQPSPYISSTKEILLLFKKGDSIQIKHQRSSDVIIEFEPPVLQWIHEEYTIPKPVAVFDMIETLLPRAGYDEILQRGRHLELWAKRSDKRREGWISFHQRKNIKPTISNGFHTDSLLENDELKSI